MVLRSFLTLLLLCVFFVSSAQKYSKIGKHDFNFDWKFKLLERSGTPVKIEDTDWKDINLPHDWSVGFSFDPKGEGATGYLPGGIGIYKKDFLLNIDDSKTTYVLFDGVYNNSKVYLNDQLLGTHPYGYSPFYFDITKRLRDNGELNTIKVEVDHSRFVDSRWYTGSGIYRNVKLIHKNNLHIPVWGVFVTTPEISKDNAKAHIKTTIKNNNISEQDFDLQIQIYDDENTSVSEYSKKYKVKASQKIDVENILNIPKPFLWSITSPRMYTAIITIAQEGKLIDKNDVRFGVRSIKFDADKGFFLNDISTAIKGVCLHHDAGLVGAAVPKDVWRRRLQKLKDAGCNAIRIAHNPGSQEFLDLCDEMGFLVQDEFFDEWDNPKDKRLNTNEKSVDDVTRGYTQHFQKWAERDLKNTMLAHRNHPSIFQWSIGNEIEWTYPRNADATGFFNNMNWNGNYFWEEPPHTIDQIKEKLETLPKGKYDIGETAKKLAKWTREMDTTRYITANCILPSASHLSGYADALDVIGYSYRRILYDYGHKNYPEKPIMGTENLVQWHEWKAVEERPFISGTFLWTGIDYMGESNDQWPRKATPSGMLDVAGFEKPSYHMMKTLWNEEPHIYATTQTLDKSIYIEEKNTGLAVEKVKDAWKKALWVWHDVNDHWNYEEKDKVVVEVYSNCNEIELCLNGESLGIKRLKDFEDRIYKWIVPYTKGELKIVGLNNGEVEEIRTIHTSGKAEHIKITTDKIKLKADGYNTAHVVAQLVDKHGIPVTTSDEEVIFTVEGEAKILGVDNGWASNVQDYQSNKIVTHKGRCLLLLQSKTKKADVTIKATSKNLTGNTIRITIE
ncbi:glycoside hydrolase family 2 TIM barrel-domain containing protein [Aquimarina algiphila]|uniref:Glycoside hydrolase family 2 protein n=1 Tax=Aquimarina algiphila TaxID=2047982 RepID=A0A554VNC3_9FLAO|nr:glycoside hydrolase family 2 TIM barrel-domain containing protein [Aquimarina algiphila]TSE09844.1 glycoside hydrolase family 2 protein [Aquimarina algiphila]